jgi:hypothetical protein
MFHGALANYILNGFPRSILNKELANLHTNLKEDIPHGENLEWRNPPGALLTAGLARGHMTTLPGLGEIIYLLQTPRQVLYKQQANSIFSISSPYSWFSPLRDDPSRL